MHHNHNRFHGRETANLCFYVAVWRGREGVQLCARLGRNLYFCGLSAWEALTKAVPPQCAPWGANCTSVFFCLCVHVYIYPLARYGRSGNHPRVLGYTRSRSWLARERGRVHPGWPGSKAGYIPSSRSRYIGDYLYCALFFLAWCANEVKLLT